ncbi:MAG TPA: glutamate--tRNA ligase [Acidimicrobiales bacterium]|nr:glutamate--tRNA ligase [Acidimicrobiales bacterium]
MTFRTRFSPAPTGFLHVGSARSALFCWLAARHDDGEVLLRVEDTNAELYRPEYLDNLRWTLDWLGLEFDGETLFQSRRADRYREVIQHLVDSGRAYGCDCTTEVVKERTKGSGYDGHCRDRGLVPGPGVAARFRVPDDGATEFDDIVRGHVRFEHSAIDDFVVQRADGSAVFFVPNAVDDLDTEITHVVRGDDLLNTTPKVLLIRRALPGGDEFPEPTYAHLPMIVNEARKKLSKRRDDVAVEDYRDRGYLPEAMSNYLAVLGWGPPDGIEIRPREEIVQLFRLEDVVSSSAFFDKQKLDHFNAQYLRQLSPAAVIDAAQTWLPPELGPELNALAPHIQERARTLQEFGEMAAFLVGDEVKIDESSWAKGVEKLSAAAGILDSATKAYSEAAWVPETLHTVTQTIAEEHGLGLSKAQSPIRVAVTGRTVGPPLFESLVALGRDRTLSRIAAARTRLG